MTSIAVPTSTVRPLALTEHRKATLNTNRLWIALVITTAAVTSGCISANSPIIQDKLKTVSAGYTGCTPADNVLSNIDAKPDGSGSWNATCKDKTYLCSAVGGTNNSESFHCAQVAP